MDATTNSSTHVHWLVYKRRWLVLAIVALLNAFCGLLWISFSYSVAFQAAKYYEVSPNEIGYFTSSMFAVNALCGLLAMWTLDKFGLKPGIRIGMLFVVLGCIFRACSTQLSDKTATKNNKFYLTLVSQWVIAVGQPFILFTPTKVAECWFPDYQRVSATTMVSMGTPLGFIIGGLVFPRVVLCPEDIPNLNCWIAVPAIIASLLSLLITSSTPPTPPSGSAAIKTNRPFFSVIKKIITEKAFLILMLYVGSALGILFALTVNLGAIISDKYNEVGCGMAAAVLMSGGIIGAIIASFIADITRKFITIMKISACFTAVSLCGLFIALRYENILVAIGALCVCTGFFAFMAYPLGLELGIECAFPNHSEASCNGLLLISGQIQGVLFIGFMQLLSRKVGNDSIDYKYSLMGQSALSTLSACIFILLFYTEYKRMTSDRRNYAENILNNASNDFENSLYTQNSIYS